MASYEDLLPQVYQALKPLIKDGRELTENTVFVDDLGFDSLKVMDFIVEVEDHFDISIPLNILPDVRTIKDFVLQLQKLTDNTQ